MNNRDEWDEAILWKDHWQGMYQGIDGYPGIMIDQYLRKHDNKYNIAGNPLYDEFRAMGIKIYGVNCDQVFECKCQTHDDNFKIILILFLIFYFGLWYFDKLDMTKNIP